MRLYAILSDIHGNYSALKAVETDAREIARQEKIGDLQFICLGDVVDYGPQPLECIDWVLKNATVIIQGNHDRAAASPLDDPPHADVNRDYWPITAWTRHQLSTAEISYSEIISQRFIHRRSENWPATLPSHKDFVLFHCSLLRDNTRVDIIKAAQENMDWLVKNSFRYGFFGHTHFQGLFTQEYVQMRLKVVRYFTCPANSGPCSEMAGELMNWQPLCLEPGSHWTPLSTYRPHALFNPGSVGQQRQHTVLTQAGGPKDYRAAYMLLRFTDEGEGAIQFRRVHYQLHDTIDLLRCNVFWPKDVEYPLKKHDTASEPIEVRLKQLVENELIPILSAGYPLEIGPVEKIDPGVSHE